MAALNVSIGWPVSGSVGTSMPVGPPLPGGAELAHHDEVRDHLVEPILDRDHVRELGTPVGIRKTRLVEQRHDRDEPDGVLERPVLARNLPLGPRDRFGGRWRE